MTNIKKILLITIIVIIIAFAAESAYLIFYKSKQIKVATENNTSMTTEQSFTNSPSYPAKTNSDVEVQIKDAMDPRTCGSGKMIQVNGYLSDKKEKSITITSSDGRATQLATDENTLYVRMYINQSSILLKEETINASEIKALDSMSVFYFSDETKNISLAKVVKLIIIKN